MKILKNALAIIFPLITLSHIYSQNNYVPFPQTNAEWRTLHTNYLKQTRGVFTYAIGDTLSIGDTLYRKLTELGGSHSKIFEYAIREADKKIFVYIPSLAEEHLLYDFSLKIGDTIFYDIGGHGADGYVSLYFSPHFKIVSLIDTIKLLDGSVHKCFYLKSNKWGNDVWVEGIGSIQQVGFFNPFVNNGTLGGDSYAFACFTHNDIVYYLNPVECSDCHCFTAPYSIRENEVFFEINVFPNPTQTILFIENKDVLLEKITLYDLQSKKLEEINNIHSYHFQIDLQKYVSGIYFLQIQTEKGITMKKIIKE